ncbi:MAG: hypothetical protein EXS50_02450 [Candidatus Taylorbacteria bacterium]|nr:hypothetical protein [Candidatus Taylorbacteria bacterium]
MRKIPFVNNEIYHIYNRGVDKRTIFEDRFDLLRFFQSMREFNTIKPIRSIFENQFNKEELTLGCLAPKLVEFIAYSVNPNHYHFALEQQVDGGISEFLKRLGGGYTNYFNEKYNRNGSLFQGTFKSVHVDSNEYLLHLNSYINLNYKVHQYSEEQLQFYKSSWQEYLGNSNYEFCKKDIILSQFKNISEYRKHAESSLDFIVESRQLIKDYERLLIE